MGGGSKVQQSNPAQAAAANAGATASANNSTALSNLYSSQQQQLFNSLYGKGGAVSGMLDPSKLDVSKPTGVYALQNTNANQAAAKQYENNAQAIGRNAAQSGFGPGTPSGFVADQQNRNARGLADTQGQNFLASTTNQYQDALNNFWKAANLEQGASNASGVGALQGNSTAANTYSNLYGTAGHGNVTQNSNVLGNLIGAAGTVGGAAVCCVAGTRIRMADGSEKPVEELQVDDVVASADGGVEKVVGLKQAVRNVVRVRTFGDHEVTCSYEHAFLRPSRGYVDARDSHEELVMADKCVTLVSSVEKVGSALVFSPELSRTHTYLANGLWSEGW
jgi:hypothetical protein